jgi:ferredoxin
MLDRDSRHIAGRRLWRISRLIRSGQPAPERLRGLRVRAEAEVVEVGGQKKLLRWTVPGLAHAFTFWGFTILFFTIIEAYGDLFKKRFAIWGFGHNPVLGFIEDFFIVAVLVALCVFTVIRIRQAPARRERASRFYGSHTGAAWLVLALIASVMITLLLYRGAQTNTGDFPYTWWAFASHLVGKALHPLGTGVNSVLETVFVILNICVIVGFLVFVSYSKHLHIFWRRSTWPPRAARGAGRPRQDPDMDMENVTEETVFGVGQIEQFTWKQMLDFATCTECGRCQSVCPAWNTGKPLSPKLVIMGLRDNMFSSQASRLLATNGDRPEGELETSGPQHDRARRAVVVRHLWGLRRGVPRRHRARRRHRRHAPLRGADGVAVPVRGRADAAQHREPGGPVGSRPSKRTDWTRGLDFEVPVVTDTIPDDIEYLYWVGCAGALDERARKGVQATARMLHGPG